MMWDSPFAAAENLAPFMYEKKLFPEWRRIGMMIVASALSQAAFDSTNQAKRGPLGRGLNSPLLGNTLYKRRKIECHLINCRVK